MKFGNIFVGKRLFVGWGKPEALGKGESEIRGSSYLEGPLQVGKDDAFDSVSATVMIGPENNTDVESHPSDSLVVEGDMTVNNGNIHSTNLLGCTGQGVALSGSTINTQGWKGFDIKHPTKDKHRLRHVCVEGPEAAIYHRGRVCNGKNVIDLPEYWKGLIDYETLTVQLTAVHSHQNVIVKRISPIEGRIYLQAQGGMPVDCFYHIMAARVDGEPLIVEYEGESPADYPGDPTQFSISGYDYGRGVNND
jgi:hypothetical protein